MILGRGELLPVPWFLYLLNGSGVLGVRLTAFTTFTHTNGAMMGTRCCSVGSGSWEATRKLEDLEASPPTVNSAFLEVKLGLYLFMDSLSAKSPS